MYSTIEPLVSADELAKIRDFVDLLLKVNKALSLTSVKDVRAWTVKQIEDSVKAYQMINHEQFKEYSDFGSGNGFPGVIFAILSKNPVYLCEIDTRKAEFLKLAAFRLKFPNLHVLNVDACSILNRGNKVLFTYRALGPEELLVRIKNNNPLAAHFRFCSKSQESIFEGSERLKYCLSDGSPREIEYFSPST